ncbi:MAG: hypothetical protein Q9227_000297 [Pyrenula ochraceoflavens]
MPRRSSYASVLSGNPTQPYYAPSRHSAITDALSATPSNSFPPPSYPENRIQRDSSNFEQDNASGGLMGSYGQRSGALPPFSRRFASVPGVGSQSSFFVPTYLRHSQYIAKLHAAYKARSFSRKDGLAHAISANQGSASLHRPGPAHRGMKFEVVEKPPERDDTNLTPLPSRWNEADKFSGLEITADGREVRYAGTANKVDGQEAAAVRSDHRMPFQSGIYYFEVTISAKHKDGTVAVGFSGSKASLERLPGWENDSWAYHSDDGKSFQGDSTGKNYGPTFGRDDVIGCGINFVTGSAFFTKNGNHLGTAFRDLKNIRPFPSVGVKRNASVTLTVNFGHSGFAFDIDGLVERERINIEREIGLMKIPTSQISLDESTLIQELVAQFLSHDGYVETARAFTEARNAEAEALRSTTEPSSKSYQAGEDVEAIKRQRIRAAILEGDIDKALKHTTAYYQRVLEDNPQILFRLKCRKFIELIRKSIDLRAVQSSKSTVTTNGHSHQPGLFDGDLEMNDANDGDTYDPMDTEESLKAPLKEMPNAETSRQLLAEAMEYGTLLSREYRDDKLYKKALKDAFSLLAYNNAEESVHGHLLDPSGRVPVAEELNAAILVSLGKSSSASIERLYQQTEALVNELSDDGGVGTLINVKERFLA